MEAFILDTVKLLQYLSVFFMSGLKFMVGVGMSIAMGLSFWEQFLLTTGGGVAGVIFFTYLGDKVRQWISQWRGRPATVLPSAKWGHFWEKYGLWGVALLTPPLLSPPIGTAVALAFGTPRPLISLRLSIAMVLWGIFFATVWNGLRSLW